MKIRWLTITRAEPARIARLLLSQRRRRGANHNHNNHRDGFNGVQCAVHPEIVHVDVFAIIRHNRAGNGLQRTLQCPESQHRPEIRILRQQLQMLDERRIVLILARFDFDLFFAAREAECQQQSRQNAPDNHSLNPCTLIVAEHLDQRRRQCNRNDTADRAAAVGNARQKSRFFHGFSRIAAKEPLTFSISWIGLDILFPKPLVSRISLF